MANEETLQEKRQRVLNDLGTDIKSCKIRRVVGYLLKLDPDILDASLVTFEKVK